MLWQALSRHGLAIEVKAVYSVDSYEDEDSEDYEDDEDVSPGEEDPDEGTAGDVILQTFEDDTGVDDYGPTGLGQYGETTLLMTASSFAGIDSDCEEGENTGDTVKSLLVQCVDAKVERDLIWAKKPQGKNYSRASTFQSYGNEATTMSCYVAGALVVKIPAFGKGCRRRT